MKKDQRTTGANAILRAAEISDEAVERLVKVMDEVLGPKPVLNGTDGEKREAEKIRGLEHPVE